MSVSSVGHQAKGALWVASPWIEWLARLGFVAKGIVYVIVGAFALQLALGQGGQASGTQDVFQTIANQPFGQFLLAIMALGLVGYSIWLFVRAGIDTSNQGTDAKGMVKRIGYAITGVVHLGLAFMAIVIAMGSGGGGGQSSMQEWTAQLMAQPFGRWLVGIGGAIVIGVGLYRIYKGYTVKFSDRLKLGEMDETEREWTIRFGRFGLMAQGVVLIMIGGFFVQAAVQYQPSEARGLGGALRSLAEQPYGPWLLAIVALGLIAHGIYNFGLARYRRIQTS